MPYPRVGRRGFVPSNHKHTFKLTHFLCIPLVTSKSRTQLNRARQRLLRDSVTRKIPSEAFVWPDTQKLGLGVLSLQSDREVLRAKSLLESLDLDDMLDELRSGNERRQRVGTSHILDDSHIVQPISVSIKGFARLKSYSTRLNAAIIDTEGILPSFFRTIQRHFLEAGLMKLTPTKSLDQSHPLRMSVINTGRLFTTTPGEKQHLLKHMPKGKALHIALRPDIAELCTKYQDFAWASGIQLEKLSICKIGLLNFNFGPSLIGQGHREIACVALPGARQPDSNAVRHNITYTRVVNKYSVDPNVVYDVTSR